MKPLVLSLALAVSFAAPGFASPDSVFDGSRGQSVTQQARARAQDQAADPKLVDVTPAAPDDGRVWVTILSGSADVRTRAATAGVSIEEISPSRFSGTIAKKSLAKLDTLGLAYVAQDLGRRFTTLEFPPEDAAFHTYDQTVAELRSLAGEAPELASLFSIGRTTQGRDMWALRLNTSVKGDGPSAKPGVLFLGTHHAREHLSTEVPLLLAKYLVENRARADVKALLADRDVFIVPMVNPDGVEYDIRDGRYHMHRKNMRRNPDGSYGVDLNRNYSWGWNQGGDGASDDPTDETYRGPAPFSEPETQAVKAFVNAHASSLKVLLSYHTYSELILYPWGGSDSDIDDPRALAAYKAMAEKMAGWTGYTPEKSSALYIATGDTCDWAWGTHKIYSFTFELTPKDWTGGGFYPGAGAIQSTFAANLKPALYLIDLADDPQRALQDAGAVTGK